MSRDDPLYDLVVRRLRDAVAAQVADERSYKTQGSVGRGNWAETPWVAVFDLNVTDTATRGYYIVYLFRTDGSAAYLSLNQGATAVEQTVGRQRYTAVLQARAATYREYLAAEDLDGLLLGPVDLGGGRPPLTPGYEAANVVATRYLRESLPAEEALEEDLHRLLGLYRTLVPEIDQVRAGEEEQLPDAPARREEARRLRWHLRAEGRNRRAVEEAKRFHGYRCQACGTDFLGRFGDPGRRCIEAHHLVPFAQIGERPQDINPITDFAIVCANCHRILHSATPPLAVDDVRNMFDRST